MNLETAQLAARKALADHRQYGPIRVALGHTPEEFRVSHQQALTKLVKWLDDFDERQPMRDLRQKRAAEMDDLRVQNINLRAEIVRVKDELRTEINRKRHPVTRHIKPLCVRKTKDA